MTASAPSGIGAPVKIRAACPGPTTPENGRPAADSPTHSSRAPALAVSTARTAYPSIAELAKGGCVRAAITSRASVRPNDSLSLTISSDTGRSTEARTRASASATGISGSFTTHSLHAKRRIFLRVFRPAVHFQFACRDQPLLPCRKS